MQTATWKFLFHLGPIYKHLALLCLNHLKRKMDTNPDIKNDYLKFMENILKKSEAEVSNTNPKLKKYGVPRWVSHQETHLGSQIKSGLCLTI